MGMLVYSLIVAIVAAATTTTQTAVVNEPKHKYYCQVHASVDYYKENDETNIDKSEMERVYPTDK